MIIPNKLKVGGVNYKIIKNYKFRERSDLNGQADHTLLEIRVSDKDSSGNKIPLAKREEIFMHEVLHCIDATYNDNKLDEQVVSRFSHGLYQTLNDNKLLK